MENVASVSTSASKNLTGTVIGVVITLAFVAALGWAVHKGWNAAK